MRSRLAVLIKFTPFTAAAAVLALPALLWVLTGSVYARPVYCHRCYDRLPVAGLRSVSPYLRCDITGSVYYPVGLRAPHYGSDYSLPVLVGPTFPVTVTVAVDSRCPAPVGYSHYSYAVGRTFCWNLTGPFFLCVYDIRCYTVTHAAGPAHTTRLRYGFLDLPLLRGCFAHALLPLPWLAPACLIHTIHHTCLPIASAVPGSAGSCRAFARCTLHLRWQPYAWTLDRSTGSVRLVVDAGLDCRAALTVVQLDVLPQHRYGSDCYRIQLTYRFYTPHGHWIRREYHAGHVPDVPG